MLPGSALWEVTGDTAPDPFGSRSASVTMQGYARQHALDGRTAHGVLLATLGVQIPRLASLARDDESRKESDPKWCLTPLSTPNGV